MNRAIDGIDDRRAQEILGLMAVSKREWKGPTVLTPELRRQLVASFEGAEEGAEPVSEGDLARQALLVAAEDTQQQMAIETMAAQPEIGRQRYDFGAGIALTAAVMMVLQTHMRFERKADGTWTVLVEKKPTKDALVKGLVQKLLAYVK